MELRELHAVLSKQQLWQGLNAQRVEQQYELTVHVSVTRSVIYVDTVLGVPEFAPGERNPFIKELAREIKSQLSLHEARVVVPRGVV